ncbi:hypothetical protein [Hathewaya massiliensis]|uniref:hypothetical protein n=1 Tax=Hathewaya massiliensis TaxID=1964382 RepID=UPI001159A69D|nr:hypothetical protein [Hathewaya massiliensis]
MNCNIIDYLKDNDLDNIKEIKISEKDIFVLKFDYYFDSLEIEGAEAYAEEEAEELASDEEFYEDFVLPYLSDTAVDNVEDIVIDISEELDLEYQLISFDIDVEENNYNTFIVAFYEKDKDFDLEDYITEII